MESILRWVALALAGILEKFGDPSLQAKLDKFKAGEAEAEAKEKQALELQRQSDLAYAAAVEYRDNISTQISTIQLLVNEDDKKLANLQEQRKKIADDLQKAKADIANQSDHDAVRADV